LTIFWFSTVTARLQVSGQSKGHTLGMTCAMGFFSSPHVRMIQSYRGAFLQPIAHHPPSRKEVRDPALPPRGESAEVVLAGQW
jgi:hypothetical protein